MSPEQVGYALLIFSGQRPELAAGESPVVVGLSLGPEHALAHHIAVGLVVIGGDAGAQPVSLIVAAQSAPAGLAFGHQGYARLTGISKKLAQRISVGVLVGNGVERGWNIAAGCLRAPHGLTRQEAAGRQGDALVMEGVGIGNGFFDCRGVI